MNKYFKIISIGALVAIILYIYLSFKNNFLFFKDAYLFSTPESITELYFEDHLNLPLNLDPSKKNLFKFTIHNLENKNFTYDYKVQALSTESAKLLKEGTFTLKHDEYKTISGSISTAEASIRTKINVSLENKNQSIHFWVNGN